MNIQRNVSLAQYSTMRLGGTASYLAEVTNETELLEALDYAKENKLKVHITGSGSNTIFGSAGFNGLVIVNKIMGVEVTETDDTLTLAVGAGEDWDSVVVLSVEKGYSDIATLSLIPGTTGAAPVQNIGAYGQQISDTITAIRAYDSQTKQFITLQPEECGFSYRHSRFNTTDKSRFVITTVKMKFQQTTIQPPFYKDVAVYFEEHSIDKNTVSPAQLREAVSTVRVIKLPDPKVVANCGSFFKNPVVSPDQYKTLLETFPTLKSHETDDGNLKLYGGQLIELVGMKDYHDTETGMATWKNQALVVINESARSVDDLITFKEKIISAVYETFGITLIQEPEYIELV